MVFFGGETQTRHPTPVIARYCPRVRVKKNQGKGPCMSKSSGKSPDPNAPASQTEAFGIGQARGPSGPVGLRFHRPAAVSDHEDVAPVAGLALRRNRAPSESKVSRLRFIV